MHTTMDIFGFALFLFTKNANESKYKAKTKINKHETLSKSCGGVFGNTKFLLIFLLMTFYDCIFN